MSRIITFTLLIFVLAFFTKPKIDDLDYVFQKDVENFYGNNLSGYVIAKLYNTISLKANFDAIFFRWAAIVKPDGFQVEYIGIFNNWYYIKDTNSQKLNHDSYNPNFKDNSVKYDES